jgi:hypothetical protein
MSIEDLLLLLVIVNVNEVKEVDGMNRVSKLDGIILKYSYVQF